MQYKWIIVEGEGTPKITTLYKFFNGIIFGETSDDASNVGNPGDEDSSGVEDILEQLRVSNPGTEDIHTEADGLEYADGAAPATLQPQASGSQPLATTIQTVINTGGPSISTTLTTITETSASHTLSSTVSTVQESYQAPKSCRKGKEKALDSSDAHPKATRRSTRKVT